MIMFENFLMKLQVYSIIIINNFLIQKFFQCKSYYKSDFTDLHFAFYLYIYRIIFKID